MYRIVCQAIVLAAVVSAAVAPAPLRAEDDSHPYGKVEVLRDSWGVPHVYADSDAGAMYGLGYAAAHDRGFQMYYFLRIVQGRMSEVFGVVDKMKSGGVGPNNTLDHDRLMRVFGFAHAADALVKNLDAETVPLLQAYSDGVNDYFATSGDREHYLFQQSGLRREPWTPADCLLSWWHFAQFFSKDGRRDTPALTKPRFPPGRTPHVIADDDAAVVRREDVSEEWIEKVNAWTRQMGLAPGQAQGPETPDPKFSHAWVIGGEKTSTGASVLVSDPQTPVWNPNMLYEFHAKGATFNVRGAGVAGSPIVLIGFNEHVAWGLTALGADQADLFILKTDPDRPDQYQVDGEWLEMTRREEIISVKGDDPVRVVVRETIFGPIASEFVWQNPEGQEVALCRVPMVETDRETIRGALGMMRAQSCEQFACALPGWRFPTANCVFGDDQGNIGYWSLGALPVRSPRTGSDGSHAQDGSSREGMWRGMIPYDILPHCINPKRGYLVTANHRTIQSFYTVPFGNLTGSSGDTDRGLRVKERILAHLAASDRFSPEDVLAIHHDSVNVWKREIIRLGLRTLDAAPDQLSPNTRAALRYLRPWYEKGAGSDLSIPGTELVNEIRVIFRGGFFGLVQQYGGGVSGLARFAKTVRARDASDPDGPVPDEERSFVNQVLDQAWTQAERRFGPDPREWNARAVEALCQQKIGYMESLDGFPALDEDYAVHLPALKTIDGATIFSQRAQAYTQFVPMHDTDAALSLLPMGNSDDPQSPYRFSTYGDWAQGRLHPAPLSRDAVNRLAVARQVLGRTPAPARPSAREAPTRRGETRRPRRASPAQREARAPLPGRKPDDPTLEMAIRYMNRPERTKEQVKSKIKELRGYIEGDAHRTAELVAGLELFTHLMRESQAGRIPIRYGNADTLKIVEAFYRELYSERPETGVSLP